MDDNNIMIDLETMATCATAAIISIGAVRFNRDGIVDEFYRVVKLSSSAEAGLTVDADTVMWWMKQSVKARNQFNSKNSFTLKEALHDFSFWAEFKLVESVLEKREDIVLWGNGSDFDNSILSNAYTKTGFKQPWPYWNNRCYRTIKNLHPSIKAQRSGVYHNALDDAKTQALHLIDILKFNKGLAA